MQLKSTIGHCLLVALALSCFQGCQTVESVDTPAVEARLFEGTGVYARDYETTSAEARSFADQGLNFVYGFMHAEAVRSFEKATRLDPECMFAWWGLAYALGPHINRTTMDAARSRRAVEAARRASELAQGKSGPLAALATAITTRYADPAPEERRTLDTAFAAAMRDAFAAHPDDADVGCVFAESMMMLRPWDLYDIDGTPRPETAEIVTTIEAVLHRRPDHPGANHAYIHAVEASNDPARAIAASDRLRDMAPAIGHLVHMPSHIDLRVGRYGDAVLANQRAVQADLAYVSRVGREGTNDFYRAHDYMVLIWAAMFDGRSAVALEAAADLASAVPQEALTGSPWFAERIYAARMHVLVRFGRWDEVLAEPQAPLKAPAAEATRRYARGVALASLGRAEEAEREISHFEAAFARIPARYVFGRTPARTVLAIAHDVLRGEVAFRLGRHDDAFAYLRAAVAKDEALKYEEPRSWPIPPRHALGALLLEAGRPQEALAVYEADLRRMPENAWSLHGLAECLTALNSPDAAAVTERFHRAFARADVTIQSSCFCRRADQPVAGD